MWSDLSPAQWSIAGHDKGTPWSLKRLAEHCQVLKGIKNPTPKQVKGVKLTEPCLPTCDVDETLPCVLHLQIGVVNDACAFALSSVQAACENYSHEYMEIQGYGAWLTRNNNSMKEKHDSYDDSTKEEIKNLKSKKKKKTISHEELLHLDEMIGFLNFLEGETSASRQKLFQAKRNLKELEKN